MSKQWENDMAKEIYRATDDHIKTYTCGYSGNNAFPQPDILITDVSMNHGAELKGPIQSDVCYVDENDIEQLLDCQNSNTAVYLVVKFSRREPIVMRYFEKLTGKQHRNADEYNDMSPAEKFAVLAPNCTNARVTSAGTLALDKPSTDDWPSATEGSEDHVAIMSGIGLVTDDSVAVTE
jgi:Holliday junction resolvase